MEIIDVNRNIHTKLNLLIKYEKHFAHISILYLTLALSLRYVKDLKDENFS